MNWDHAPGGIGLQVARILKRDASAPCIEGPQIEIEELIIGPDVGAFELADLARPHASQNADQETPVDVRLHEIGARLPEVDAVLAASEQREFQ